MKISIHSPRARGDTGKGLEGLPQADFNPLPSCEGRRRQGRAEALRRGFQSTPLVRGETCRSKSRRKRRLFQSTPLVRGETAAATAKRRACRDFNPLPSCEGRRSHGRCALCPTYFNPLPSCEGRPARTRQPSRRQTISIHSPRARGDAILPLNV